MIKYVVPGTVEQIVGLHSVGLSQGRLKKFRVQKQKRTDLSDQLCIQSISWHAELKSCMVVTCASTTYLRSSTNSIHIFYLDILSIQCCTFIYTHTHAYNILILPQRFEHLLSPLSERRGFATPVKPTLGLTQRHSETESLEGKGSPKHNSNSAF